MGPRLDPRRSDHLRGRPRPVVEARQVPAGRERAAIDVFGEIDEVAFQVALRSGLPVAPMDPPRPIGHDRVAVAVFVEHRDLRDDARRADRVAFGWPVPGVQETERVRGARSKKPGHVERLVIVRVRIAVRLTFAGPAAVDPQLVLLVARHVRDADSSACVRA